MQLLFAAAVAAYCPLSPASAQDSASPWATSSKSAARLIAAPANETGVYRAGIEIKLSPNTITYWRSPGESGVSPVFDFAQSSNVQSATVSFPAPRRIDEGGSEVFGYDTAVVLPIRVQPNQPGKPVDLVLELDYAACEKICLPVHASLRLTLPPKRGTATEALAAAEAAVPRRLSQEETARLVQITPISADTPTWRLTWRGGPASDLFAEGPDLFYIETKRSGDAFLVSIAEHPKGLPIPDQPVRFTLTGEQPAEFALHLDGSGVAQ